MRVYDDYIKTYYTLIKCNTTKHNHNFFNLILNLKLLSKFLKKNDFLKIKKIYTKKFSSLTS